VLTSLILTVVGLAMRLSRIFCWGSLGRRKNKKRPEPLASGRLASETTNVKAAVQPIRLNRCLKAGSPNRLGGSVSWRR